MVLVILLALVTMLVGGVALSPRDGAGQRPLISAYNVTLALFAVYAVLPAGLILANDYKYVWASAYGGEERFTSTLVIISLGLFFYLLGFHTVRYGRRNVVKEDFSVARPREVHTAVLLAFIGAGLLLKLYLVYSTGGIEATIARLSGAVQSSTRVEDLNSAQLGIRTLSGLADAGAVYMLIQALRDRRNVAIASLVFAAVFVLSFMTMGKRLSLIIPALALLLAIHSYWRPITTRFAPFAILGALALGMTTLLTRILVPATQNGTVVNFDKIPYAEGSILRFYFYSLEFSSVEMMTVTQVSRDNITAMFGGVWETIIQTNLTPILFTIPRAIWPGKPTEIYDVSYAVSSTLDGTKLAPNDVGYASTYIGTTYIFAGVVGVVLGSVFLGWLSARVDMAFTSRSMSPISIIFYALMITVTFHAFRQGTVGWTFIVSIIQQYGLVIGVLAITLFRRDRPHRDVSQSRLPQTSRTNLVSKGKYV